MHPYLVRLGITLAVQNFFEPYWRTDSNDALLFDYGNEQEHYSLGFHRLPISNNCWIAGESDPSIKHVFICSCAMEAISFLAIHRYRLPHLDRLLFIATGGSLNAEMLNMIRGLTGAKVSVIHEHSLLGHIYALKIASIIRGPQIKAYTLPDNQLSILFRHQRYHFDAELFSLSTFEKASGFRFHIRCERPKSHLTFLDQLKAASFIPNL